MILSSFEYTIFSIDIFEEKKTVRKAAFRLKHRILKVINALDRAVVRKTPTDRLKNELYHGKFKLNCFLLYKRFAQ